MKKVPVFEKGLDALVGLGGKLIEGERVGGWVGGSSSFGEESLVDAGVDALAEDCVRGRGGGGRGGEEEGREEVEEGGEEEEEEEEGGQGGGFGGGGGGEG